MHSFILSKGCTLLYKVIKIIILEYILQCCSENNKGLYFSIIWFSFSLSSILGNLLASLILLVTSQTNLFILMSIVSLLGSICLVLLKEPTQKSDNLDIFESNNQRININQSSESDRLSHNKIIDVNSDNRPHSNIKSTIQLLVSVKMLKITGLMLTSGIIWGMIAGFLPKVVSNVVNDDEKLTKIINCMFVVGVGQISGSFITGRIVDAMGDRFTIISIIVMILAHFLEEFTFLWYVTSFLLGAITVSIKSHLGSIVGSSFENSTDAYGCSSFSQSYIVFIILVFESFIKNSDQQIEQRIFIIFYGVFGILSCLIALTFPFKTKDIKLLDRQINLMELADNNTKNLIRK